MKPQALGPAASLYATGKQTVQVPEGIVLTVPPNAGLQFASARSTHVQLAARVSNTGSL